MASAAPVFVAAMLVLGPEVSAAQVVQMQAGTSSVMSAHGGSVDVTTARHGVSFGLGRLQSDVAFGFRLRTRVRRSEIAFGDDVVDFQLPTDLTSGARYVQVRGAGVTLTSGRSSVRAFAGGTSTALGAAYFRGATWGRPLGLLFADRPLGSRWAVSSRNAVGHQLTSIQSVAWKNDGLSLSASAGLGAGRRYAATVGAFTSGTLDLRAGFSLPAPAFRRLDATSPMAAETEREQVAVTWRPGGPWSLAMSRQHLVATSPDGDTSRASVNQASGNLNLRQVRLGGSLFRTDRGSTRLLGTSMSVGRRLGRRTDLGAEYYRSVSSTGDVTAGASLRVREELTPRLNLLQVVTASDGNVTANLGGQFLSNLAVVDVGYQTTHTPFGPDPFVTALTLDVRVHVLGLAVTAATYVTPQGSVRYTVSGSRFMSAAGGARPSSASVRLGRYAVRGTVVDAAGQPVAGAALTIGDEFLLTDARGTFLLRMDKARPLAVRVLCDEFAAVGHYEVVSAPPQVTPAREDEGDGLRIVVRRR